VHICHWDSGSDVLRYAVCTGEGVWETEFADGDAWSVCENALTVDAFGTVHVSYWDPDGQTMAVLDGSTLEGGLLTTPSLTRRPSHSILVRWPWYLLTLALVEPAPISAPKGNS
jgi:hypothetical protein